MRIHALIFLSGLFTALADDVVTPANQVDRIVKILNGDQSVKRNKALCAAKTDRPAAKK